MHEFLGLLLHCGHDLGGTMSDIGNGNILVTAFPAGDEAILDAVSASVRDNNIAVDEIHVERGRLDEVFRRITATG